VKQHWRQISVMLIATAVIATYIVMWSSLSSHDRSTRDFTSTYTAATIIRLGKPADIFDWHVQAQVGDALMAPDHLQLPYLESALVAALVLPLTALPLPTAFILWSAFQLTLVIIAVVVAVRAAPRHPRSGWLALVAIGALALAGPGTENMLAVGTSSGFSALGVAMAYRCWRGKSFAAGGAWLAATAMIAKPHLALGILLFVFGWGNRRAIVGAIAGGGAALVAFVGLVGWHGVRDFALDIPQFSSIWSSRGGDSFFSLPSMWFDDTTMTYVVGITGGCVALALCFAIGRSVRRDASRLGVAFATAVVLSLLATSHAFLYDAVMLAPAVAWCLAEMDLFSSSPLDRLVSPWAIVILWAPAMWIDRLFSDPLTPLVLRVGELDVWWTIGLAAVMWFVPNRDRLLAANGRRAAAVT
jgi:glycosyl transferase family 87